MGSHRQKEKAESAEEQFIMKVLWRRYLWNYFTAICLHFTPLVTWALHKTDIPGKKNIQMLFSCFFFIHVQHTLFK